MNTSDLRETTDLKLFPDTSLIPWPAFIKLAYQRRKDLAVMFGLAALIAAGVVSPIVTGLVGVSGGLLAGVASVGAIAVGAVMYADPATTKSVVVFRRDSSGEVTEDHQRWWIADANTWPDKYKKNYNGARVLFIDALGEKPIPFDPWINPAPVATNDKLSVTGTRVAAIKAKQRSASRILKYREAEPGEKFQQGLFAMVIVACLVATLMAADRVAQMYGYAQ